MAKSVVVLAGLFLLGAAWAQKPDEQGSQNSSKPATATATAPAVETHTYKGALVDASCGGNVTQNGAADKSGNTADRTDAGATANGKSGGTDENKACAVSATTKEFALRTKDGRVLHFDTVGNERAAEMIKNKKNWTAAASGGKAISAKVTGALDGTSLTVVTLD